MRNTPTPGQLCYEAYVQAAAPAVGEQLMRWDDTSDRYRAVWDAAAQAVLARCPHCTAEYQERYGAPQEET